MYLRRLVLQSFRSYPSRQFQFQPTTNLILGPNGSGKTNLLEAIGLLTTGVSFRSTPLSKLIYWNSSFATVQAFIGPSGQPDQLETQLIRKDSGLISRKFLLNQVAKTRRAYIGSLLSVIFHPEDLRLITGSPSRRRDLLDHIFSQFDWRYTQSLTQYRKALKHRNELLDLIRLGKSQPNELFYWNQSLIKNDEVIHGRRQKFIDHVNNFFTNHPHPEIKDMRLNYCPSFLTSPRLEQNYQRDLDRGYTQFGNHRDDFTFDSHRFPSDDKNLAFWGSRGQQRLAVLALRLAQIDFLHTISSRKPVLLLDDIFSELDSDHRHLVTRACTHYQSLFTSSEQEVQDLFSDVNPICL